MSLCATQIGFNAERSLTPIEGDDTASSRGVLFARYIFMYGSSLYLPPRITLKPTRPWKTMPAHSLRLHTGHGPLQPTDHGRAHYHIDYLTPYWDPEAGYRFDSNFSAGVPIFGEQRAFQRTRCPILYDQQFA